ncbi:MAG: MarR family winged helix-turn-helix transcriptional regulator [Streptosporangiaceae bacterium]
MTEDLRLVGLGTLLRQVLDQMDADIAGVLADLGLPGYKPRYSVYLRAVAALGPAPIRDLARATGVTHSAASQTVAELARQGLVDLRPGADGRQRIVHLTDQARAILPTIEAEWDATAAAADELDAELPFPLRQLVPAVAAALDRRPFRERMLASAWAREHPFFTAVVTAAVTAARQATPGPAAPGPADSAAPGSADSAASGSADSDR